MSDMPSAYGDLGHPGFMFLPPDLEYFIHFEENNRLRRGHDGSARLCPTAEQYHTYQVGNGTISGHDLGGFYNVYALEQFSSDWTEENINRVTSQPRRWYGAPMAAVRRGIYALDTINISRIPTKVIEQLRRLQD